MTQDTTTSRPSMADVGRLANVSTQTVSRYFTGVGYVGGETRERIAAAIEQLGYRRNQSARNFRRQRMDTIGVLSMGPLNYGSAEILTGLSAAARRSGLTLTITQLDLSGETVDPKGEVRRAIDALLSLPVDGVAVLTPFSGAEEVLAEINGTTALVTLSDLTDSAVPIVSAHSRRGAQTATEHLLGLGHSRVIHVAGPPGRNESIEREQGYRAAMTAAGQEPLVVRGADEWTSESGFRCADSAPAEFTAVFAANDEIALGFMHRMEQLGYRAPKDFSIVGVDDMPSAAHFSPPLTTVRLDFRALGTTAFEDLLRQVETGEPAIDCGLEPHLVIRESTAPYAATWPRRDPEAAETSDADWLP